MKPQKQPINQHLNKYLISTELTPLLHVPEGSLFMYPGDNQWIYELKIKLGNRCTALVKESEGNQFVGHLTMVPSSLEVHLVSYLN